MTKTNRPEAIIAAHRATITEATPGHGFAEADADTPEVCLCGATFAMGDQLQIVKRAHLKYAA